MNDIEAKVITVIVADDIEFNVAGIAGLLSYSHEVRVIGRATSAQEAVALTLELKPDVLLLDMVWKSNKKEGLIAIRQLKQARSKTSILAMSAYEGMLNQAQLAGAAVVTLKTFIGTKDDLVKRIKDAYRARDLPPPGKDPLDVLTPREWEVLILICDGFPYKRIAQKLGLKKTTIAGYTQSIFNKLGVNSSREACAEARNRGFPL